MTYRIDGLRTEIALELAFQGVLDAHALAELHARIDAASTPVRLLLRSGTEVDSGCIDELRGLPVAELGAESPFLARWLSENPK